MNVSEKKLQRFCLDNFMNRKDHIQYLKEKYEELRQMYAHQLVHGDSLAQIKDLSYVLQCLSEEISALETTPESDTAKENDAVE